MTIENNLLETRKSWRRRWISLLYFFANIDFQANLWTGKLLSSWGDYGEVINQYFDDLVLDSDYKAELRDDFISEAEYNAIINFHTVLKIYSDDSNKEGITTEEVIIDRDWRKVTHTAYECWKAFKLLITEPEERELILKLEDSYPLNNRD